jgi:ketosteroid isomerase-like protein
MKFAMLVLVACVLVSCAPPAPDVAALRKQIDEMLVKGEKDMVAGTMDTTMSQYAENPVSMPNNGPMLNGKAAMKEYYGKMMGSGIKFTKVDFITKDVQASGKYVYEVGTYTMTMQIPAMQEMTDEGKYLTVYEIGADGKLKIKVETWNTNAMPPMPGAGS